jgi:hypothetical protein
MYYRYLQHVLYIRRLIVLFGYTELIFKEIIKINKRRLNTVLKKIIKRASFVNFLSVADINIFQLESLMEPNKITTYYVNSVPEINFKNILNHCNFIDLYDYNDQMDISVITELVLEKIRKSKRIYISLDTEISVLKSIFNELKNMDIDISTNDNPDTQVVINSSIKTQRSYLFNDYDVFIISTPLIYESVDVICYLKLILHNSLDIQTINNF